MNQIRIIRGIYRRNRSLKKLLEDADAESHKDYYFRIRNRRKAVKSVLAFVYSPGVRKDRRLYSACRETYQRYCELCKHDHTTPLTSWQFKHQMQLLGFVYQRHHRFYDQVTTAYKNIGLIKE